MQYQKCTVGRKGVTLVMGHGDQNFPQNTT